MTNAFSAFRPCGTIGHGTMIVDVQRSPDALNVRRGTKSAYSFRRTRGAEKSSARKCPPAPSSISKYVESPTKKHSTTSYSHRFATRDPTAASGMFGGD